MKYCQNCGAQMDDYCVSCPNCGRALYASLNTSAPNPAAGGYPQPGYQPPPVYMVQNAQQQIPPQYTPLSAWAYFGYELLFAIPLVGFILLIVFSFSDSNINRRNFARSYFCVYVIMIIVAVVVALVFGAGALAFWEYFD